MLTANELRIGNWILGEDYCEMQVNCVALKSLFEGLAVFEPITLTPDILEKSGLEKIDEVKFILGNGYFYDCANHWVRMAGDGVWPIIATNVINVHRLQNLYFALTGEELEIKL